MKRFLLLLAVAGLPCASTIFAADTINSGHPRYITPAQITNIHNHVVANDAIWQAFRAKVDTLYGSSLNGASIVSWIDDEAYMYVALRGIPGDLTDGAAYDGGGGYAAHTAQQWGVEAARITEVVINYCATVLNCNQPLGGTPPCPGGVLSGCSDSHPPSGGNFLVDHGWRFNIVYDLLQYDPGGTPVITSGQLQDIYNYNRYSLHYAINSNSYKGWCTGAGWTATEPAGGPGGYQGPDDNECTGAINVLGGIGVASFGDGTNPFDNQDRFGNPLAGTNYELDFALNDTSGAAPLNCCGLRTGFETWFNTTYGVGGVRYEGGQYGANDVYYMGILFNFLQNGTNFSLSEVQNFFIESTHYILYGTVQGPDTLGPEAPISEYYTFPFCDVQSGYQFRLNTNYRAGYMMMATQISQWQPTLPESNYLRFWYHNIMSNFSSGDVGGQSGNVLLFNDFPSSAQTDYRTVLPKNYTSNTRCPTPAVGNCSMNMAVSLSNWGNPGTTLLERGNTPTIRHGHQDAGTIEIWRNGRWLLKDLTGYGDNIPSDPTKNVCGVVNTSCLYAAAESHNMFMEQGISDGGAWKSSLSTKADGDPVLEAYDNDAGDHYVYTKLNNTKNYHSAHLAAGTYGPWLNTTYMLRELTYLKPDRFVLFDRGTFGQNTQTRANFVAQQDATTNNTVNITGGIATAINVDQQISIKPMFPTSGTTLTSSPLFGATLFSLNCSSGGGSGCQVVEGYQSNATNGNGKTVNRILSTNTTAATSALQIHFMESAASGATMTSSNLIHSGHAIGVDILDGTTEQIVLGSDVPAGTSLTLPVSYSFAGSAGTRQHFLSDLPPNTKVSISVMAPNISITANPSGANITTAAGTLFFTENGALSFSISPTSVFPGVIGYAMSQQFTATGGTGPYTWSETGALPTGLIFSSSGLLSGTPSVSSTDIITVTATDSTSATSSVTLSITVSTAPTISTSSLPAGTMAVNYNQTILASGGNPGLACSKSLGTLPTGISISDATGGCLLSGTPTGSGTFNFTVQVSDATVSSNSGPAIATQAYSLVINAPAPSISIDQTSPLPAGTTGTVYSQQFTASGGSGAGQVWSNPSGALPPGLTLTSGGLLSGTPTTPGTYTPTIQVTDSGSNTTSTAFTIVIGSSLSISTSSGGASTVIYGIAYGNYATFSASGGASPYTWSIPTGNPLPNGFLLNPSTGVMSGTPGSLGLQPYSITVTDANGIKQTNNYFLSVITGSVGRSVVLRQAVQ